MITACALLALSFSGLQAQSNHEYNFRQQWTDDGARNNNATDHVPILDMPCLAANGFGQWTLSKNGIAPGTGDRQNHPSSIFGSGWYLLGNSLYTPSTQIPVVDPITHDVNPPLGECTPPGVIQNGPLAANEPFPIDPKVTANLDRTVCYVWPNPAQSDLRKSFVVQSLTTSDFDISSNYISNGATYAPNRTIPMQVVKNPIHEFPAVSPFLGIPTGSSATPHRVLSTGLPQDQFDVASDAAFLYIVWCTDQNMSDSRFQYEVWATVVDLSTMTPVAGWPKAVQPINGFTSGWRPTVACDPRQNRTGTPVPKFDVAFISNPETQIGMPIWLTWANSTNAFIPIVIESKFIKPDGTEQTYGFAKHVRALVSSVPNAPAAHRAMYAMIDIGVQDQSWLIFYNPDNPNYPRPAIAAFVDGDLIAPASPIPAPGTTPPPGWPVQDAPIVAFANPYDNGDNTSETPANWREFDQFHCLYQIMTASSPLVIVRGCDNGLQHPAPIDPVWGGNDTRLVLNQNVSGTSLLPDNITSYVTAVNQMGIHVHWRTETNRHYYLRDISRTFDEDIEEWTIASEQCTVSDGTVHGGTVGAKIVKPSTTSFNYFLLWTDPNYGTNLNEGLLGATSPKTVTGIYPFAGQLSFVGSNVRLTVAPFTFLITMPFFYFHFNPNVSGQELTVNGTWDYFGLMARQDPNGIAGSVSFTPHFLTTPFNDFSGQDDEGGSHSAGTIRIKSTYPDPNDPYYVSFAQLNVWQGADFFIGYHTKLIVDDALVHVLRGPSTFPLCQTGNHTAYGHLTLKGQEQFKAPNELGFFWFDVPDQATVDLVSIQPELDPTLARSTDPFFSSDHFQYFNVTDVQGLGVFDVGILNRDIQLGNVSFTDDHLGSVRIHAKDLFNTSSISKNFAIQGCTFNECKGKAIFLERSPDHASDDYSYYLYNNTFTGWSDIYRYSSYYSYYYGQQFGIYVKNFLPREGTLLQNSFPEYFHPGSDPGLETNHSAAICLENSSANVESNSIQDPVFNNGIYVFSNFLNLEIPLTSSLICSITITGLRQDIDYTQGFTYNYAGVATEKTRGYVKLNTISNSEIGYSSGTGDEPNLVFNTINSLVEGLTVNGASLVHLSGVHSDDGSQDYEAVNSITNSHLSLGAISFGDWGGLSSIDMGNFFSDGTWSHWGHNNIIASGGGWVIDAPNFNGSGHANLHNIDNNFFASGTPSVALDPRQSTLGWTTTSYTGTANDNGDWGGSNRKDVDWITYEERNAPASQTTLPSWAQYCDDTTNNQLRTQPQNHPSLKALDDSSTICHYLYVRGVILSNNEKDQQAYDTLKLFIERCPNNESAPHAFYDLAGPASALAGKNAAFVIAYNMWLRSVLYLNTSDPYFCACADNIASSSPASVNDTTHLLQLEAVNRGLAVLKWLIDNTDCDTAMYRHEYDQGRASQLATWYSDTTIGHLDTTLPSLADLGGLDTLFAKHALYQNQKGVHHNTDILTTATASPNPTGNGTVLTFGMAQAAYVRVELFDVLGVPSTGYRVPSFEQYLGVGNHSVPMDLSTLPSGTYYARLTTAYGETRTVKIVKN